MLRYFRKLRYYYESYKREARVVYGVVKVDADNNSIILHLRGRRTTFTYCIDEVVKDYLIIGCLSSEEACALGIYCGVKGCKSLSNDNKDTGAAFKKTKFRFYLVREERGKYRFADIVLQKQYCEEPLSIVQNRFLITNFSPEQAFHIGIMAGKKYNRVDNENDVNKYKYNKCFKLIK